LSLFLCLTAYSYDGSSNLLSVLAVLPGGAVQETRYLYEIRTSTGSALNSNDVRSETRHPDASTGWASASEEELTTVNAVGQAVTFTDRNGTEHTYSYDVVGRLTSDDITYLASGVDPYITRLDIAYDTAGRAYLFTSYTHIPGLAVVNQVQRAFNGLGQVTAEYQAHDGEVNTSTSPVVQYAYSEMDGGANHSRLTGMIYPDGRELSYIYDSGLDTAISRLSAIVDDDETVLEEYSYLGLGTVVIRAHPEPGVRLTYVQVDGDTDYNDDGGDQYTGFDRFGRIIDQFWADENDDPLDRFQYGYDRASNRLYKDNLLDNDFDELYHANGPSNGYDKLNRLTDFRRGPLSDTNSDDVPDTVTTASLTQSWNQDAQGNFDSVSTGGTPESRTHNLQNQLIVVGSDGLTYDGNGNLTEDENDQQYVYDAWNRQVEVLDDEDATIARYERDALGRVIERTAEAVTTAVFYSVGWQELEQQVEDETTQQKVWSPVYIDALILRDRDTNDNGDVDERLYAMQDGNWNVTGVVTDAGSVAERMAYEAYGEVSFLEDDWDGKGGSDFEEQDLYQGRLRDEDTNQYDYRRRVYSSKRARFNQSDPLKVDSNYYLFVANRPTIAVDPTGLVAEISGNAVYSKDVSALDGNVQGTVKIYPGAKYKGPGGSGTGGLAIEFKSKGNCKCKVTFLQFVYSTVYTVSNTGNRTYLTLPVFTTTQPDYKSSLPENPNWVVDSASGKSPYYVESGGAGEISDNTSIMYDQPSAATSLVKAAYLDAHKKGILNEIRFIGATDYFKVYLLCNGKPFYEIRWAGDSSWKNTGLNNASEDFKLITKETTDFITAYPTSSYKDLGLEKGFLTEIDKAISIIKATPGIRGGKFEDKPWLQRP